ncbi:MAG: DUF3667 domain-containing protein [Balneola sp.]|nr:DUF3667 domain-containing protein [Balneola sp.]MBO6649528.1 DUF3667 domain-containing protein [Balneola sp.]MBO6711344.1 DUF3667 domain-containing protein [Balneola sp.]MBO6801302.1 DUF3667 domain-containing protein [Balneola sp.]MBO6869280.1 DUF3667 domain-containing protein [Balneola sp.]
MDEEQSKPPQQTQHKGFLEELMGDVFNLDRGLPGTIWGMIKTPGVVIDAYFTDRGKYVTPLRYCIFILAVTTFISVRFVDYEEMMKNAMEMGAGGGLEDTIEQLSEAIPSFDWKAYFEAVTEISVSLLQKFNQVLYLVLLAPPMAFFLKLFFKKKKGRFIEHYVLMVYSLTTLSIFGLLMIPFVLTLENADSWLSFLFGLPVTFIFLMWTSIKYLGLKGFSEYLQAFLALFLGYLVFAIFQAIVTYIGAYLMVVF